MVRPFVPTMNHHPIDLMCRRRRARKTKLNYFQELLIQVNRHLANEDGRYVDRITRYRSRIDGVVQIGFLGEREIVDEFITIMLFRILHMQADDPDQFEYYQYCLDNLRAILRRVRHPELDHNQLN